MKKTFYDTRHKHKKDNAVVKNIANHPFVLTAVSAAIALVVLVVVFQLLNFYHFI